MVSPPVQCAHSTSPSSQRLTALRGVSYTLPAGPRSRMRKKESWMGSYTIAVLAGDGIGPEVTTEAVRVLQAIARRFGHKLTLHEALVGQAAIVAEGAAISDATMELCQHSDAILFGAVGGVGVGDPNSKVQPESALFRLRKE